MLSYLRLFSPFDSGSKRGIMDSKTSLSTAPASLNEWTVEPVDPSLAPQFRARIDGKAKPLGALGRLEDLAVQLGSIWHPEPPRTARATVFVFAADHGITAEGVSAYPSAVTAAMVATYLAGRAGVNALARACNADVRVIDAGVDADLPAHPELIDAKVRRGSRNAVHEPAMTLVEERDCLARGVSIVSQAIEAGTDIVAIGEMGIGNTTSAALLMHRLAQVPLADCVGAGTGLDAAGIARKLAIAERAAGRSAATSPLEVLAEFGGYEIAMMAGAVLGSAMHRRPVIIDGFIASAAALVAIRLRPAARGYCVFSHGSAERGHGRMLAALDAKPYLDLGLRLGEGTGAVMMVPLVRAAGAILTEMADLSDVMAGTLQPWSSDRPSDIRHG
jgi:nicotinate-nucleotide--dimethylbenzimidazole phosphoribosyltransferase